jgi:hypothetical protein
MSGQIAHAAVWNVALNAAQIAALARGVHPLAMERTALVAYWPLFGFQSPEQAVVGEGFDLTLTGTVKGAGGPPVELWRPGLATVPLIEAAIVGSFRNRLIGSDVFIGG